MYVFRSTLLKKELSLRILNVYSLNFILKRKPSSRRGFSFQYFYFIFIKQKQGVFQQPLYFYFEHSPFVKNSYFIIQYFFLIFH